MPGFIQLSVPEAKQGKPVRTDSNFLSTTLSQCTYMVIEDLCRAVPAVCWAPFQTVPDRNFFGFKQLLFGWCHPEDVLVLTLGW